MQTRSRQTFVLSGALAFVAPLVLIGCGGSSTTTQDPPALPGDFGVSTGALVDGAVWQLNRAITIQANRTINFASLSSENASVMSLDGGLQVQGIYSPGLDPVTGEEDRTAIRFQPACPLEDGDAFGFEPGADYVLVVRGSDTWANPIRSTDGDELESTLEVAFTTATGTDPSVLFYDAVSTPPRVAFRGQSGVPLDDPNTTRFEIGKPNAIPVLMRRSTTGLVEVDPGSSFQVGVGLPLNHYIVFKHRVGMLVEFDQAISLSADNLARVGVDFLDASAGTWRAVPCRVTPVNSCGRRGSAVRLEFIGTLPPEQALRLRLDAGFRDLSGQALPSPAYDVLPLEGASEATPLGSRVDAVFEAFSVGGDEPGSMEDIVSPLGVPRGHWGGGFISGVETPSALSAVRSKWYPLGLAGHDGFGAPKAPTISFAGVDPSGVVLADGGTVTLGEALIGPVAPAAIRPFAVDLRLADLIDPTGLYAAQPGLLSGDRLRLRPAPMPGTEFTAQIFGSRVNGASVELSMGVGCYAPGIPVDCIPWDLSALFPNVANTTAEIIPRSFGVYTWITRDAHSVDHRVTISFDAARAGADGRIDESTALSAAGSWVTRLSDLSGQPWDFLRFEVRFDLDVSGNGYQPLERSPVLDFLKIPVDFRR